ncbi:DUF4401 domain-containing protein [Shewanella sp. JM162201]|uniref:DUF4401 domain-containing protein n=1 Tax=Shewanella jiangmenensis TaxID=2837387 RepID=A0ABS5UXX7_9GAMM|nr:DUF4401 domain-containing protein [Shewanella jiangmenensis]MBT1442919.1 DUF4401 domain-containing protein [Shewanella jiangmenensis]
MSSSSKMPGANTPSPMAMLWDALQNASLISNDSRQTLHSNVQNAPTPLWLMLLSGVAGWVAALFFLGFSVALIASIGDFDSSHAFVVGLIYVISARFIYAQAAGKDFFEQLGFAINLAAMIALMWGVMDFFEGNDARFYAVAGVILLLNGVFAAYRPDALLSVFGALLMLGLGFEAMGWLYWLLPLLLLLMMLLLFLPLFGAQVGSASALTGSAAPLLRRIRQSLLLGLLVLPWITDSRLRPWDSAAMNSASGVGEGAGSVAGSGFWPWAVLGWHLSLPLAAEFLLFAVLAFATLLTILHTLNKAKIKAKVKPAGSWLGHDDEHVHVNKSTDKLPLSAWLFAIFAVLLLTTVFWFFPALAMAMLLWLVSWQRLERLDVVWCLIAALGSFSLYYYQLSLSLLTKSLVLMALGAVLLAFGVWCKRRSA